MNAPQAQEPRLSAVLAGQHRESGFIFGVVGKRTYLVAGGECHEHPEQVPLVEEPVFGSDEGVLLHDADLVLQRMLADIIVEGHAYPHERRPTLRARVGVGDFVREIGVLGDRRLERGRDGSLQITPPQAFEKMPLGWEHAYGGVDEAARLDIGDPFAEFMIASGQPADPRFGLFAYPRNPVGKGYLTEPTPAGIEACRLPNLEEPNQLLTPETIVRGDFMRWPTGPMVAALGWLSHNYFPRIAQFGLPVPAYDNSQVRVDDFFEVRARWAKINTVRLDNAMADRMDVAAAQQSAMGMRTPTIDPAAAIELVNLHPGHPKWRFRLPGQVPKMAYRLPGQPATELRPMIRTLTIEPDLDRVTVVWVGETRVSLPVMPQQLQEMQHGVVWR